MRSRKTIKEIAAITGFSTATVDRVINGRDGVKDNTRKTVLLAARELSYKNVAVRLPDDASGRVIKTAVIIPETDNELINKLSATISAKATGEPYLVVEEFRYKNLDSQDLVNVLTKISELGFDAIGLVGVDDPKVAHLINRIIRNGVKVITLLSVISSITPLTHIGINDNAAGRTAGLLMMKAKPDPAGTVVVFTGSTQYQGHLQREIGFRGILRESGINVRVAESFETREDRSHTTEVALGQLKSDKEITGIYVIGSGAAEIVDACDSIALSPRPVIVCHDMTESVMHKLFAGKVDYIIHQDLFVEATNFINVISNIYWGKEPLTGSLPVRINIVTTENIYSSDY